MKIAEWKKAKKTGQPPVAEKPAPKAVARPAAKKPAVRPPAKKPSATKVRRVLPCIVPGCGNPSKGPRFHFLCDEHRTASPKQIADWQKAKKAAEPTTAAPKPQVSPAPKTAARLAAKKPVAKEPAKPAPAPAAAKPAE